MIDRQLAALAGLLLLFPGICDAAEPDKPPVNVTTASLKQLLFIPEYSAPASTLSLNNSRIHAETSGRILALPVRVGDRIEPRWVVTCAMFIMMIVVIGIWKAPSLYTLMICGPMFGFCYGTCLIMNPIIIGNYFGPDSFAGINGIIMPILVPFSAVIPVGAGTIVDKTGSYDLAFIIVTAFVLVGIVCGVLLSPPVPKAKREAVAIS